MNIDARNIDNQELLAREEAKRGRMWNPAERWRVLQETITWAEQQLPVPRNTPTARLAEQSRKLEAFRLRFGRTFDAPSGLQDE